MSVIRLQEMTPQIYTEESRDFQLLSRLYDSVFNGLKFDTDSILDLIDTKECRTSVLQLLQTKLGFFTERKIDDEKLRSILECFPILVRNKGSLRAIKETLYLFLRMYSVSSNMEIYYLPTPYSPPFSEEEPCVLASGKLPENNSLIIRIHSFETKPDTSVMEEIFRYILPAGINYYIEFDKGATLQDIVLKSEDSAELTFVSDNINSQLRSSDQTEPYNIGTVNTSSLISTDSYVSNRFIGYYGDEQSASDYLATLVDKIYSTAVINYSATGEVSGPIVSISDAEAGASVEALSVAIEPVQDLHGYDAPWPAGGGKQLYNSATFSTVTSGTITCTNNGDGSFTLNADEADTVDRFFDIFNAQFGENLGGNPLSSAEYRLTGTPSGGSLNTYTMYTRPSYSNDTGSGVTFTNSVIGGSIFIKAGYRPQNLVFRPMIRLASVGDDTFATYSNLCPISGRTELNVPRTGKNLVKTKDSGRTSNQVTFTVNADGSIKAYGTATGGTAFFRSGGDPTKYGTYIKAGTYKLTGGISNTKALYLIGVYVDGIAISNSTVTGGVYDKGNGLTFTLLNDAYIAYQIQISNGTEADDTFYPMICKDTSAVASDFSPYVGTTYLIPFGQIIYGCQIDVLTGKAMVTKVYADAGSLPWGLSGTAVSGQYRFACPVPTIIAQTGSAIPNIICSQYKAVSPNDTYTQRIGISNNLNLGQLIIFDPAYKTSSAADFKTAMSGVQIVYPLAEPFEITLTPTQVELLQGENNLWSDAGDISITYKRDGTYKAMICTAYSSNTPTWHRINFLGNLTTEEVSTQGGIVAALQAKGITVNNGDLIKYNNLYLLRVNNDWQECNYARYILNTYHLTE